MVDCNGLEPLLLPCDGSVLPLDEQPKSGGAAGDRTPGLHTASVTLIPTELLPQ